MVWFDMNRTKQPSTPPSCSSCSPASRFFPTLHTLFSGDFLWMAAVGADLPSFRAISLHLLTLLWPGVLRVSRNSTWNLFTWVSQIVDFGWISTISVLISTCSGISALHTRVHRPSEFRGHRGPFTDPAPAQRSAICVFSRGLALLCSLVNVGESGIPTVLSCTPRLFGGWISQPPGKIRSWNSRNSTSST